MPSTDENAAVDHTIGRFWPVFAIDGCILTGPDHPAGSRPAAVNESSGRQMLDMIVRPVCNDGMRLTVDVGKSGTRIRTDHQQAEGPGADPAFVGRTDGAEYVAKIIERATDGIDSDSVTSVMIGSTAIPERPEVVLDQVRPLLPSARMMLFEDLVLSHAAALGAPGVVATVGTGVGIAALGTDQTLIRVDGWGPDLGDRGSAWQLGRDGLRAGFAAEDGSGPPTRLQQEARNHLGGLDLGVATRLLSAPDRITTICAFAQQVLASAAQADPVAAAIVDRAADDLVAGLRAAARRSGTTTVVLRGRPIGNAHYRARINGRITDAGLTAADPVAEVLDVDHDLLTGPPYRDHAVASSGP